MTWAEIVQLTKDRTREEVHIAIDIEVVKNPALAAAGNRCKAVLDHVYAASAEGGVLADQMGEVFSRISE